MGEAAEKVQEVETEQKVDKKVTFLEAGFRNLGAIIHRFGLAQLAGLQFGGARDLYAVFGYRKKFANDDFLAKYVRQDIVSRIIDAPPGAVWSNPPKLVGGVRAAQQWEELVKKYNIWNVLYRADRLARLNHFSIVLMGFDDTADLTRPLSTRGARLLYMRPIGSRNVEEIGLNTDSGSERFGRPERYRIRFDDPAARSTIGHQLNIRAGKQITVHHSRVVHIVENSLEDDILGIPIIERCFNLLDDLLKVVGGTAETYWLTGNRGLQADIDKEMDVDPADAQALADEIDQYMHQLRRFIRTRGVKLNPLGSETPNPQQVFNMIMALLSGTTGIPRRILLGSEVGSLASEQDRANWAERVDERRKLFAWPIVLLPVIQLLQRAKVLANGELEPEWPDAFIMNPLENAQMMAQKARAIGNMSRQTGNKTPMQITSREESRNIIGLEGDLPESEILETEEEETGSATGDSGAGSRGTGGSSSGNNDEPATEDT